MHIAFGVDNDGTTKRYDDKCMNFAAVCLVARKTCGELDTAVWNAVLSNSAGRQYASWLTCVWARKYLISGLAMVVVVMFGRLIRGMTQQELGAVISYISSQQTSGTCSRVWSECTRCNRMHTPVSSTSRIKCTTISGVESANGQSRSAIKNYTSHTLDG